MNYLSKVQPEIALSTRQIVFKPGDDQDLTREGMTETTDRLSTGDAPDLTVTVTNTTENFVSFQLELAVAGQPQPTPAHWYEVEPNVCAKKPPGDRTEFHVNLLRSPIPAYDTTVPLQVNVFSAELASLSATETVYLKVLRPAKTLRVFFPFQDLSVYPGARLKIPVLVYNLNPQLREVTLRLEGVNPEWFPEGIEQTVWVDVGGSSEVAFWCAPPAVASTAHGPYRLSVQAIDADGNSASASGHFQMLPFGQLNHAVADTARVIPDQLTALTTGKGHGVIYDWGMENASNVAQTIYLKATNNLPPGLQLAAASTTLAPATSGQAMLQLQARRPWLGWPRTHFVEVAPVLEYPDTDEPIHEVTVVPHSELLSLKVNPHIPLLVQLLIAALSGLTLWGLWFLSPKPLHQGSVNVARLLGNADTVISGSSDQTLRHWQVDRAAWLPNVRRLRFQGVIEEPAHQFDKAIRVAEVMPANVKQVAVGLENGEIQLWDVDPPQYIETLLEDGDFDRVFDLAFTNDSRYLFSGHGSGNVRGWTQTQGQWHPEEKLYWGLPDDLSFAIASLAVSPDDELVAIAGQFNRLTLWDWQNVGALPGIAYDIPYSYLPPEPSADDSVETETATILPVTSRNSYLTSVDFANQNSRLMATADSLGIITMWDLQKIRNCMPTAQLNPRSPQDEHDNQLRVLRAADCPAEAMILAQWPAGQRGNVIREIAFDKTGCYLASTGDDGRISVWPLTTDGTLTAAPRRARIAIDQFPNQPLNSIDIHRTQDHVLLIAADTPGQRVQLYRQQVSDHGCQ